LLNAFAMTIGTGTERRSAWQSILARIARWRFRRLIVRAFTLRPRGFAARDDLRLDDVSAHLRVEWRSRDVHPWDRDVPPERRSALYLEQLVCDTDAVIVKAFATLPDVDAIELRVREPHAPNRAILAGTVTRDDLAAARGLASPRMRLAMLGVRWVDTPA
jgi:hypothetical protein